MATRTARRKTVEKVDTYSKIDLKRQKPYIDLYLKSLKEYRLCGYNKNESIVLSRQEVEKCFIKFYKNIYNYSFEALENRATHFTNILIDFYTFREDKNINYYFIQDNSLIDFFQSLDFKDLDVNSVFFNNPEMIKNEKIRSVVDDNFKEVGFCTSSVFVLNTKKLKHSLIIRMQYGFFNNGDVDYFSIDGLYGNGLIPFSITSENNVSDILDGKYDEDNELVYFYKILLGFFCYITTFNDSVVDGAPHDAVIVNHNQKSITLKTNEIVIRVNEAMKKHSVSPHLRRGHFRMLTSDYYKKKKGKLIFIEPTFIKGTAKTLIENTINGTVN